MREIKFRAWNGKQMIYLSEQYIDRYYMQIDNQAWGIFDKENSFGAICNSHNKNDVLMQYTGLKDKNGQEIFEGDIVKYHPEANQGIGRVAFEGSGFYVTDDFNCTLDEFATNGIEVIGNVYENDYCKLCKESGKEKVCWTEKCHCEFYEKR